MVRGGEGYSGQLQRLPGRAEYRRREDGDDHEYHAGKKKTTTKKNKDNGKVKGSNREKEETGRGGDTSAVESAARLPQTGQLWWPVWLLAGIAAVLVILGLILRISGKKDLKE